MKTTAVLRACLCEGFRDADPADRESMMKILDRFAKGAEDASATTCEIECEHGMFLGSFELIVVFYGCGSGPAPGSTLAHYPMLVASAFDKTGLSERTVAQLTEDILVMRQKE